MGCDYHIYTYLDITTKDGKKYEIEYEHERRYILEGDNDDETYKEILERRMTADEETKKLFSEGKWLIKNKDLISVYEQFIVNAKEGRYYETLKIALDDITEISRVKECVEN